MIIRLAQKALHLSRNHYLINRSILVVAASFIANIFGYLFQLVAGRYFSLEDYATLVALFSLSGIIPIAVLFFTNGIPKAVAEIKDIDYPARITVFFYSIFKIHLIIGAAVFIVLSLFARQIAAYLQITDLALLYIFAIAIATGIALNFMIYFLQGLLRFKAFSFMTFITSFLKFGVILVVAALGLGVIDIYKGLIFTTILVAVIGFLILRKNITLKFKAFSKKDLRLLLKYSLGGAAALAGITLLSNVDVVLVKHIFSPDDAGLYGSITIIGKIIFYAASPVGMVMLPVCAEKFKKGENYVKPFLTILGLAFAIAGSLAVIYALFPSLIIRILFGVKYLAATEYLPLFGVFMLLYTLLVIVSWFAVAISEFKIASLTLIAAISQYVFIEYWLNGNFYQVIWASILATGSVLILLLVSLFLQRAKHSSRCLVTGY